MTPSPPDPAKLALLRVPGRADPRSPLPRSATGQSPRSKATSGWTAARPSSAAATWDRPSSLERPEESLILQAIRYEGLEMPPSGKLPPARSTILTRWVKEGLAWPAGRT